MYQPCHEYEQPDDLDLPSPLMNRTQCSRRTASPMKKTLSVDFLSHKTCLAAHDSNSVASSFSRRTVLSDYSYSFDNKANTMVLSLGKSDWKPSLQPNDASSELYLNSWTQIDDTTSSSQRSLLQRMSLRSMTIGKVSMLILILGTLSDRALSHIHKFEAFRSFMSGSVKSRSSLGSAAISSVTETLSPILPFTGGLDLRREDYWTSSGNWFETLQDVVVQVQEAFAAKQELATIVKDNHTSQPASGDARRQRRTDYISTIAAQKPFVDIDLISDLTLGEVAETFQFAVESSKKDFNEGRFLSRLRPRVRKVIVAMQTAVVKSRGHDVRTASVAVSTATNGDIDALMFSAAMRIFAEWRLVRQVPSGGYKGYAVGMSLGHKDVVQNVAKIEHAVHEWLDYQRDHLAEQMPGDCSSDGEGCNYLRSPTLSDLLHHEIEIDINPSRQLPRLQEKTAAMGLLWVRRQLQYQTLIFDNILKVNKEYPSTKDAVAAAYKEVYDRFHGWAVQKIFNYSFQAAPGAEVIFRQMNPHRLKEAILKSQASVGNAAFSEAAEREPSGNPIQMFMEHIGAEWDKIGCSLKSMIPSAQSDAAINTRGGGQIDKAAVEEFITKEMVEDGHREISAYLQVVRPLLIDLEGLFSTLNMDDPTKV